MQINSLIGNMIKWCFKQVYACNLVEKVLQLLRQLEYQRANCSEILTKYSRVKSILFIIASLYRTKNLGKQRVWETYDNSDNSTESLTFSLNVAQVLLKENNHHPSETDLVFSIFVPISRPSSIRQINRQIDRQIDRQIERLIRRQIDRQMDRQINK